MYYLLKFERRPTRPFVVTYTNAQLAELYIFNGEVFTSLLSFQGMYLENVYAVNYTWFTLANEDIEDYVDADVVDILEVDVLDKWAANDDTIVLLMSLEHYVYIRDTGDEVACDRHELVNVVTSFNSLVEQ